MSRQQDQRHIEEYDIRQDHVNRSALLRLFVDFRRMRALQCQLSLEAIQLLRMDDPDDFHVIVVAMRNAGFSTQDLIKLLNTTESSFVNWQSGKHAPSRLNRKRLVERMVAALEQRRAATLGDLVSSGPDSVFVARREAGEL